MIGVPEVYQSTYSWWEYRSTNGGHILQSNFVFMMFKLKGMPLYCLKLLMQKLLESRIELHPILCTAHARAKDLLFLDLALASAIRTRMEMGLKDLNYTHPPVYNFFLKTMPGYVYTRITELSGCFIQAMTFICYLLLYRKSCSSFPWCLKVYAYQWSTMKTSFTAQR